MASRFWVGGTGTWDASDTSHWSATSGGSSGASVPGTSDTVTFDGSSGGGTVTVNTNFIIISMTWGAFTGTIDFSVNNNSPTFGTASTNGSCNGSGTGTRSLKMGSGTWLLRDDNLGGINAWNMATTTNLTFDAGTSLIKLTNGDTGGKAFLGGGLTYYNIWFAPNGGISHSIDGSNTFNDFKFAISASAYALNFVAGTTQTINTATGLSGASGKLLTINTSSSTSTHALVSTGAIISCDFLSVQHSVATPANTWYAGTNSTNNQAVATAGSGWIFTAPGASPSVSDSITVTENVQMVLVTQLSVSSQVFAYDGTASRAVITTGPQQIPTASGRVIVSTSGGNLYLILKSTATVQMYKSTNRGITWTLVDSGHSPTSQNLFPIAAAIDNSGIIHVFYADSASNAVNHNTFDTSTDLWGTSETALAATTGTNLYAIACCLDSNSKLHLAASRDTATSNLLYYVNKISGSWGTVLGATFANGLSFVDITCDNNNLPVIAIYTNSTDKAVVAYRGDANNPSSFAPQTLSSNAIAVSISVAVDTQNNLYVSYSDASNTLKLAVQRPANAFSSWTLYSIGFVGKSTSLGVYGTEVFYFFVGNASGSVAYTRFSGGLPATSQYSVYLGSYLNVHAKWSNYFDNTTPNFPLIFDDGTNISFGYIGGENVQMTLIALPTVSDAITVSESVTMLISNLVPAVNDSITVSESVTMQITSLMNVNDSVTITEDVKMQLTSFIFVDVDFSPSSISGLEVWYDASQLVGLANGDPVSSWTDESGNGANATTVGVFTAPIYKTNQLNGLPIVHFDAASNHALRATYTQLGGNTAPWTMLTVARYSGTTKGRVIAGTNPPVNWLLGWWSGAEQVAYYDGTVDLTGITGTQNWRQFTGKGDGSTGYLYGEGSLLASSGAGFANPEGGIALNGYSASANFENSDCEIAEVLLYNTALSNTDRQAVEQYLIAKWLGTGGSTIIQVTESVQLTITSSISVSDAVTVTENVQIIVPALLVGVSDAISVSDVGVTILLIDGPVILDAVTVSENVQMTVFDKPSVSDAITVTESVSLTIQSTALIPSVNDTVTVSESVQMLVIERPSVSDAVTVTESVQMIVLDSPSVFDSIAVAESVTMLIPTLFISVSDTVTVTESANMVLTSFLSVFDSIKIDDSFDFGLRIGSGNNVLTVANSASLDGLTALTLEGLFVIPVIGGVSGMRIYDSLSGNTGFQMFLTNTGLISVTVGNGTTTAVFTGNTALTILTTTHLALSWDGTTVRLFQNGVLTGSAALSGGNTGNPAIPLLIGNRTDGARGFNGIMDELRISNIARYTAGFTPQTGGFTPDANTVMLLHLNEGTGTTAFDASTNANNATLSGTILPAWVVGLTTPAARLVITDNSSISDSVTVTESVQMVITSNGSVSDSITVSESVTMQITSLIGVSDRIYTFDTLYQNLAFYAPLQTTLLPALIGGSPIPTNTRATTATFQDWENVVRTVKASEARFFGARRVQNLIATASNDFRNLNAWVSHQGAKYTVTPNIAGPDGSLNASRLTITNGTGGIANSVGGNYPAGGIAVVSIWLRVASGTLSVDLYPEGSVGTTSKTTVTVTTTWQRFASVPKAVGGLSRYFIVSGIAAGNSVELFQAQTEDVTGQSNQNPGEYVSVGSIPTPFHGANVDGVKYFATLNGNTISSNVVTEATGAAIIPANGSSTSTTDASGPFGFYSEVARTNTLLQSENFGTSWTNVSATVTTDTTAAPSGPTVADTIAVNAAGIPGVTQSVAAVAATSYVYSVFIKQNLSATRGTAFYATFVDGSPANLSRIGLGVDPTTGNVVALTGGIFTAPGRVASTLINGYYRITFTATAPASTATALTVIAPGAIDTLGGSTLTAGTSVATEIFWGAQMEAGVALTSYIPTTTVSVTRNVDILNYPATGNIVTSPGTVYAEYKNESVRDTTNETILSFSAASFATGSGLRLQLTLLTIALFGGNGTTVTVGISGSGPQKVSGAWTGLNANVYGNGVAGTPISNLDYTGSGTTLLNVGELDPTGSQHGNGFIRNIEIYSTQLSTGQIQGLPTQPFTSVIITSNDSVSDSITVSENVQMVIASVPFSVNDTVSVSENVQLVLSSSGTFSVSDAITVTESVTMLITSLKISVNDAVAVTEQVAVLDIDGATILDAVLVSEFVTMRITSFISVSDSVTVTESVTVSPRISISVSDAVSVAESVTVFFPIRSMSVSDSVTVTESVSVVTASNSSVFDIVTVSESVTLSIKENVGVFDTVAVTEALFIQVINPITAGHWIIQLGHKQASYVLKPTPPIVRVLQLGFKTNSYILKIKRL